MDRTEIGCGENGLDSSGLGKRSVADSYEYANEIPGSIKGGEILD
jgi:hypothetical protein